MDDPTGRSGNGTPALLRTGHLGGIEEPLLQLEYFRRYQLDVQREYYGARGAQHRAAAERMLSRSSAGMAAGGIASGIAGILAATISPAWAALAAFGLAGQALGSAAENAEATAQNRRNAERYARTRDALDHLWAMLDPVRAAAADGELDALRAYVESVHEQLSLEHRQWLEEISAASKAVGRLEELLEDYRKKETPALHDDRGRSETQPESVGGSLLGELLENFGKKDTPPLGDDQRRSRAKAEDAGSAPQAAAAPRMEYTASYAKKVDAEAIADAVQRERLKHLDAVWHASSRSSLAAGDSVDCSVFSRPVVPPDSAVLIQAFVYLPDRLDEAARRATAHDAASVLRGPTTLEVEVERGSRLCFHLSLPGATIVESFQSLLWKGKTGYVTFSARFADDAVGSQVGKLLVSLSDVPIGVIRFLITVSRSAIPDLDSIARPTGRATRYRSAFISYASRDRPEVIRRVQILEALGIEYFHDLLDLDPGQRWEKAIYRAIDDADLFLLFWSSAARESSFVSKEIGYAIHLKEGQDEAPPEIIPIVIEGPPAPAPPAELAHLQFSDRILYFLPRQKAVVREQWATCPGCGVRFATYGETWDGWKHKTCGTSLELVDT